MRAKAWAILMTLSAIQLGVSQQSANSAVGIPEKVGIYAVLQSEVKEVPAETAEAHHAGMALDNEIASPHSPLRLGASQEFIIRPPEGYSASEYRLLKLEQKKDHRQYREMTVHPRGGFTDNATENALPFTIEKTDSHAGRVRLNLDHGEYVFISPQPHSRGLGKFAAFTFGVDSSPASTGAAVRSTPSSGSDSASTPAAQFWASSTPLGATLANSKEGGVEITGFLPDSTIQVAGLHVGDVIKAVDLKPVKTAEDLREAIAARGPGANVRISYVFLHSNQWWVQKEVNVSLPK